MIKDRTLIDAETGEILNHTVEMQEKLPQEKFIQVYLNDLSGLLKLDNATQIKILAFIWNACNYSTDLEQWNKIAILKPTKEKWMKELDCTVKTIDNTLEALVKKKLITRICRGLYVLNPDYFFKGTSAMRKVVLKMKKEYFLDEKQSNSEESLKRNESLSEVNFEF